MRKWLVIIGGLAITIVGILWWLGQSYDENRPEAGEIRMEIDHVF